MHLAAQFLRFKGGIDLPSSVVTQRQWPDTVTTEQSLNTCSLQKVNYHICFTRVCLCGWVGCAGLEGDGGGRCRRSAVHRIPSQSEAFTTQRGGQVDLFLSHSQFEKHCGFHFKQRLNYSFGFFRKLFDGVMLEFFFYYCSKCLALKQAHASQCVFLRKCACQKSKILIFGWVSQGLVFFLCSSLSLKSQIAHKGSRWYDCP